MAVVVGVGRSGWARAAVRWAAREAALRGEHLRLVHAWDEPLDVTVELAVDLLPGLPAGALSCAVSGRPATVLVAQRPALLVLGRSSQDRRLSPLTRFCQQFAGCPVVVVPDQDIGLQRRVVVGVCGTDASRTALCWAAEHARRREMELRVVHAWQLHPHGARDLLQPAKALSVQHDQAADHLQDWVRSVLGAQPAELVARHGGPLDELLAAADDADLLVIGRSTHTGRHRVLHGVLGQDLSRLVPCALAVIPL